MIQVLPGGVSPTAVPKCGCACVCGICHVQPDDSMGTGVEAGAQTVLNAQYNTQQ